MLPPFTNSKILVVDDDVLCNELMCFMLKELGVVADQAFNGKDALERAKGRQYDIILMDVKMPIMDGIEATVRIHSDVRPELPIIAITAFAMPEDRQRCFDNGMNDVMLKPIELEVLSATISKYCRQATS